MVRIIKRSSDTEIEMMIEKAFDQVIISKNLERIMEYFSNGSPKREFYIDRERDDRVGPYKTWYENGRLKIERNYLNDSKHGLELSYNSDGTMKESGFFYHGTPDSCRAKVWV